MSVLDPASGTVERTLAIPATDPSAAVGLGWGGDPRGGKLVIGGYLVAPRVGMNQFSGAGPTLLWTKMMPSTRACAAIC